MPKWEVFASETVFSSCIVEADSPEEAMHKAEFGEIDSAEWIEHDSDDFEVHSAIPCFFDDGKSSDSNIVESEDE